MAEKSDTARGDFDPADWKQQQVPRLDEAGTLRLNDKGEAVRIMPAQPTAIEDITAQPKKLRADAPPGEHVQDAPDEAVKEAIDVSFVRDARRQAWWRKPLVRGVLVLFSLLLAALLLLQLLVQQRDNVAALQPESKPWLQALCGYLHCEVGPMRRIEAIVIDSSSFNKLDNDSYRLSFSLKNTGATPVAMPALEVTLTDTQEQALIRRVLMPAQFGAANMMLVAGADFSGSVVMQVLAPDASGAARSAASAPLGVANGPLRVAGYRVLAFYP
jgi:hypothetical protein